MMKNDVILEGKAFKPKYQVLTNGTAMLNFSLSFGNRKNEKTDTWEGSWIEVKGFKQVANESKNLAEKQNVSITGFLKQESWTDATGRQRSTIVLIATKIYIADVLQPQTIASMLLKEEDYIPF